MHDIRFDLFYPRDGVVVVSIRGSLGPQAYEAFENAVDDLLRNNHDLVILDIADLTHIGSRALGGVVRLRDALDQAGSRLRIAAPRPEIARLFAAARLDSAFPIFGSVQDAIGCSGANR